MDSHQSKIVVLATLLLAILQECSGGAPQLDFFRDLNDPSNINRIGLGCVDITDGSPIPSALFYLNDTLFFDLNDPRKQVEERPVETVAPSGHEIFFIINPQAEGDYTCGARFQGDIIWSQARTLVGKS